MARVTYVSGGCRSGKSAFALKAANRLSGRHFFVATSPRLDPEMNSRIHTHERQRDAQGDWRTIEEQVDLPQVFRQLEGISDSVVVVDCLTLWVNNLVFRQSDLTEGQMFEQSVTLANRATRSSSGHIFFVTSEVGLGLVPETSVGRHFRDLLGTCNQVIAHAADEVFFLVSGIPLKLK